MTQTLIDNSLCPICQSKLLAIKSNPHLITRNCTNFQSHFLSLSSSALNNIIQSLHFSLSHNNSPTFQINFPSNSFTISLPSSTLHLNSIPHLDFPHLLSFSSKINSIIPFL